MAIVAKSRLITIPFALGIDQQTAPRELEPRALREAVNVRQRRLNAFGMRADYLAVGMDEFDGTLVPYDLYPLNGRLLALGDRQTRGYPTDLFEYVGGTADFRWKATIPPGSSGIRIPPATAARNIGQAPDTASHVQTARVAANNGLVCLAYGSGSITGGATSHVHIFRADIDATIVLESIAAANAQVVVAGSSFWIIGVNSSNDLVGFRYDPISSDNELRAPITLYTGTVTNCIFACCGEQDVSGTPARFGVFVRDGSTTRIRVFSSTGVQAEDWAGPAVAADVMAINMATLDETVVVTRVGVADAFASRYTTSSNALLNGPTALFGESVTGSLFIERTGVLANEVMITSSDRVDPATLRWRGATSPAFSGTVVELHNYIQGGIPCMGNESGDDPIGVVTPLISGDRSNHLVMLDAIGFSSTLPLCQVDQQIANPLLGAVGKGGQVCRDYLTGKLYWARILEGTDAQAVCGVTEVIVGSTARRQACQVGNTMLLTGAMPVSFDGRQIVESGFLERPVFTAALASSAAAGNLISGATYDYVAIYQWVDGQGRSTKSRLSDIQTITLGAADDSVTAIVAAPHTFRRDANSDSTPVISLYRVDAVSLTTPATILGANLVDPPSASLNGEQFWINVTDSSGTDLFIVTFDGSATSPATIVSQINAVTTGRLTASNEGGRIRLTVDEEGEGSVLQIHPLALNSQVILGFTAGATSEGTTSFTKGKIFHLTATQPVPITDATGKAVTLVDITSDEDLLEAETLYTQGELGALTGILEREAPPPCRFASAVGQRAFIGGLPDPTEVAISFELSPAEALSFSSEFAFHAWVDGDVTAVASLDGIPIAFTRDRIYRFPNAFPDEQGGNGELAPPIRIPSEGGCANEHSILETSAGLFYEARDGKLMILPRGGASPVWIGQLVQDSLESFPIITGAAYSDEDHIAAFFCQNTGGTASIVLVYDLKIGQWYRDEFAGAQVIKAATDYQGRLAYIDSSLVRLQSSSLTPVAFIPYNAKTGSLSPFMGQHGGWGHFISVTIDGEFRGNATLTGRISYDDGVTFTSFAVKTFATPTFAVGQSFTVQWYPRTRKGSTFVLDFAVTALSGAATAGLIINSYTIEVVDAQPIGRARTTSTQRG